MCVAVCVTDGAPGEYEGRGVNFLLKRPNTCVRSFHYYFGETRGEDGTKAFLSPAKVPGWGLPAPQSNPDPQALGVSSCLALGPRMGSILCIFIKAQMHPSFRHPSFGIFRVSGKGTEQGRQDRAADVWPEKTQDVSRPRRSMVVLQPQGHWSLHLQVSVWGSECAPVPAPCLPTCVGLIEEKACVPGFSPRSPGFLGPRPPLLLANQEPDSFY